MKSEKWVHIKSHLQFTFVLKYKSMPSEHLIFIKSYNQRFIHWRLQYYRTVGSDIFLAVHIFSIIWDSSYWQIFTEIKTWVSNCIHGLLWNVITYLVLRPKCNDLGYHLEVCICCTGPTFSASIIGMRCFALVCADLFIDIFHGYFTGTGAIADRPFYNELFS